MALDKNGKTLPKGITYRKNEERYMGRFMYHGTPYTVYGKTVKDTQKKLDDMKYEVEHEIYFKDSRVTFGTWFEIWIKDYKAPTVKRGTVSVYKSSYNLYIKDVFGNKQLRDIRTDNIQRFYNSMSEKHARNTLEICRAILNGVFQQAVKDEIVQKNPVKNATLPKGLTKAGRDAMTVKEQKLFLDYARDSKYYLLMELALATGMRSGEIRGLQWNDVDFNNKVIHIRSALVYVDGVFWLDSPKTESSIRDIPMLKNVQHLLKKQRKEQSELRLKLGERWIPQDGMENLVFTTKSGKPIINDMFRQDVMKVVQKINDAGIEFRHVSPHIFRHTFATRCIENGIPPKVLQTILGHKDLATTMDTYAHVMPDTKAEELKKIADLFG